MESPHFSPEIMHKVLDDGLFINIEYLSLNCCEFLASDDVIFQSVTKPFFKMPVFGAPLDFDRAFQKVFGS